jgi:dipeptidase
VVAGKKATADGSVLNSHTDCGPDNRVRIIPGQKFKKGAMAPVFWGLLDNTRPTDDFGEILGYIPQAELTYTYFHSAYSQINEHQLCIGESTTNQRPELELTKGEGDQIMTIEQAQVFALQRCKTAREALELMTTLMETYGFLPSCGKDPELVTLADPDEVWVLEFFAVGKGWKKDSGTPGCIWAAQRLPDDHVAVISNWSVIKEIDLSKPDQYRASSNYMSVAIEHGWYDPNGTMPFIWSNAYAGITPREAHTHRQWLFNALYNPGLPELPPRWTSNPYQNLNQYGQTVEPIGMYPFSFKPNKLFTIQDIMEFQRSTFTGTIYDKENDAVWYIPGPNNTLVKSPLATPFPSDNLQKLLKTNRRRLVSRVDGEYGFCAQLRKDLPNGIGGIYWVFVDNAYTSPYIPFFTGVTKTPDVYMEYHPDHYSDTSVRWAVDVVDNLLNLCYQEAKKDLVRLREPMEQSFFEKNKQIEKQYLALYRKNPKAATELLNNYAQECADTIMETYRTLRNTLFEKYTNNKLR